VCRQKGFTKKLGTEAVSRFFLLNFRTALARAGQRPISPAGSDAGLLRFFAAGHGMRFFCLASWSAHNIGFFYLDGKGPAGFSGGRHVGALGPKQGREDEKGGRKERLPSILLCGGGAAILSPPKAFRTGRRMAVNLFSRIPLTGPLFVDPSAGQGKKDAFFRFFLVLDGPVLATRGGNTPGGAVLRRRGARRKS